MLTAQPIATSWTRSRPSFQPTGCSRLNKTTTTTVNAACPTANGSVREPGPLHLRGGSWQQSGLTTLPGRSAIRPPALFSHMEVFAVWFPLALRGARHAASPPPSVHPEAGCNPCITASSQEGRLQRERKTGPRYWRAGRPLPASRNLRPTPAVTVDSRTTRAYPASVRQG
jgi:hypothetical protein